MKHFEKHSSAIPQEWTSHVSLIENQSCDSFKTKEISPSQLIFSMPVLEADGKFFNNLFFC